MFFCNDGCFSGARDNDIWPTRADRQYTNAKNTGHVTAAELTCRRQSFQGRLRMAERFEISSYHSASKELPRAEPVG